MNILLFNHEFPPVGGGAASATAYLSRELAALGASITVVTTAYQNLSAREQRDGYRIIRVPALRKNALESRPHEIASYLCSAFARGLFQRPDIVHAFFGVPAGLLGYAFKKLRGWPYLISFRGRDVHGGKNGITGPLRTLSLPVWRLADACIANSAGLRDIALRVAPGLDIGVIPNGIDTRRFTPALPATHQPIRLLYAGRLEPYKGLEDLFHALHLLRDVPPYHLRVVGDGSLRRHLPDLAQRLGLPVAFDGPVPGEAMPDIYRNADVFILPSIVEGMPNVVLEAMASGLPVIATRIPGSEDLVAHERTGYLTPPQSPPHLSDAIAHLLKNPALRTDMGAAARRDAEQRAWPRVAEAYLDIYHRIAAVKGQK